MSLKREVVKGGGSILPKKKRGKFRFGYDLEKGREF